MSDNFERALHAVNTDRARCEIFDPATNLWTETMGMPQTIGDPGSTGPRACWFAPYSIVATENGTVTLPGTRDVAYGANGQFRYKRLSGTFVCGNDLFGDPAPNVPKVCMVGPSVYALSALEGQTLQNAVLPAAYGANGRSFYKLVGAGATCGNGTFGDPVLGGDPIPGVAKACDALFQTFLADEGQPFSGVTQTVYYGSGLNGAFLKATVPSGICNNTTFGGDPDFGHVKHCWGL